MSNNDEEIRKLAYQIWDCEGRPNDRSAIHWEQASILVTTLNASEHPQLKRSIDPSEASGSTEPNQPDQT